MCQIVDEHYFGERPRQATHAVGGKVTLLDVGVTSSRGDRRWGVVDCPPLPAVSATRVPVVHHRVPVCVRGRAVVLGPGCGPQGVHARLARDRDDRDADQIGAPACDDKGGFRPGIAEGMTTWGVERRGSA
jgi:hypothetical protein